MTQLTLVNNSRQVPNDSDHSLVEGHVYLVTSGNGTAQLVMIAEDDIYIYITGNEAGQAGEQEVEDQLTEENLVPQIQFII